MNKSEKEKCRRENEQRENDKGGVMVVITIFVQTVNERCGQTLGTSSTYQNKKKYPYKHVSGNV
jgi:hypothetical protein